MVFCFPWGAPEDYSPFLVNKTKSVTCPGSLSTLHGLGLTEGFLAWPWTLDSLKILHEDVYIKGLKLKRYWVMCMKGVSYGPLSWLESLTLGFFCLTTSAIRILSTKARGNPSKNSLFWKNLENWRLQTENPSWKLFTLSYFLYLHHHDITCIRSIYPLLSSFFRRGGKLKSYWNFAGKVFPLCGK